MPGDTVLRVILGPLSVAAAPLCRIVAWFGEAGVKDMCVEGWAAGRWSGNIPGLPSIEACMGSGSATAEQIKDRKIPSEPWPEGYQPKLL